jgi:hypothetical protein
MAARNGEVPVECLSTLSRVVCGHISGSYPDTLSSILNSSLCCEYCMYILRKKSYLLLNDLIVWQTYFLVI